MSALSQPEYRLFVGGLSASNLGQWMQQFAIGWLVATIALRDGTPELAGSYIGAVSLAGAIPAVASGLLAGVYADRLDRRDLLTGGRIASAMVASALAAVVLSGNTQIWLVILLAAAATAAFAIDSPGRMAMIPSVVPSRAVLSAVGLTRATMQVAQTLGPLIAGILVSPIGVAGIFLVKAALDGVSILALRLMRAQPVVGARTTLGVLSSLREGLGHIRHDSVLRACAGLQVAFCLFGMAYMQLLPAFAVDTLRVGAVELSWMMGANGAGALLGAVGIAGSQRLERRGLLMLVAMLMTGALVIALGTSRELVPTIAILVLLGIVQQLFLGSLTVVLALVAPDSLRGRVMGIQAVVFFAAAPIGVFAIGSLGGAIGISSAFMLGGAVLLAVAVFGILRVPTIATLTTVGRTATSALMRASAEQAD